MLKGMESVNGVVKVVVFNVLGRAIPSPWEGVRRGLAVLLTLPAISTPAAPLP